MMGIWGVFYFLQYYFDDVLGGPGVKTIILNSPFSGEQFSGTLFLPALLLLALPTSIIAGSISDRLGRKIMVYISGIMMTVVCLIFHHFSESIWIVDRGGIFRYWLRSLHERGLGVDDGCTATNGRGGQVPGHLVGDGYLTAGNRYQHWRRAAAAYAHSSLSHRLYSAFCRYDCVLWVGYASDQAS